MRWNRRMQENEKNTTMIQGTATAFSSGSIKTFGTRSIERNVIGKTKLAQGYPDFVNLLI